MSAATKRMAQRDVMSVAAGAFVCIGSWVLREFYGVDVPGEVAGAFVTLLTIGSHRGSGT